MLLNINFIYFIPSLDDRSPFGPGHSFLGLRPHCVDHLLDWNHQTLCVSSVVEQEETGC